jgi:site-specific DNA-cytosine methylase
VTAPEIPQPILDHNVSASEVPQPLLDNVPATCCYFCRGRGGNADQECVFAGGADPRCNRCISDKKRTCRQATAEEIRTFAARCNKCKIRGFKKCDGGRPHFDTCIRNNTQASCWKPRQNQTREHASSADVATLGAVERSTPVNRPSWRRRTDVDPEVEHPSEDVVNEQGVVSVSIKQSNPARGPSRKRTRVDTGTKVQTCLEDIINDQSAMAKDDTIGGESVLENNAGVEGSSSDVQGIGNDQIVAPGQIELDNNSDHGNAAVNHMSDSDDNSMANEQAASTDATSMTEDEEAQIQREMQEHHGPPSPEVNARSRRSLPRISYVEPIPDTFSDQEPDIQHDDDDESDAYLSSASVPESVVDEDFENEDSMDEQSSINEENDDELYEEAEASIMLDTKSDKLKSKSCVKKKPSNAQDGKGIDFKLPPIDNIEDAFVDMVAQAIELGLDDVLKKLNGRQINVATMCSGTESPLLAFEMLSKALEQAGHAPLNVHQKFAADIEVFKQAFIERNQSPEIIFRDVREFIPDNARTAITAYGAEANIPSGLDVLIAGFVCKDISRLNSQPKGLEDDGESGDTWRAIYSYAKRFRPSIVLLENVKGLSKLWNEVVALWDNIDYEAAWLIRDTKRYRIPQTRERMYMIAIERNHFGKDVKKAVIYWQDLMEKLQRQCSSPYEAWLKNMLHESSDHSALCSEVDWALCKLRYDHIRSEERLGILRPITKWSENGTVRYVATTNNSHEKTSSLASIRPPSFANRAWYNSQSSRVYDAIDVAHL